MIGTEPDIRSVAAKTSLGPPDEKGSQELPSSTDAFIRQSRLGHSRRMSNAKPRDFSTVLRENGEEIERHISLWKWGTTSASQPWSERRSLPPFPEGRFCRSKQRVTARAICSTTAPWTVRRRFPGPASWSRRPRRHKASMSRIENPRPKSMN